MVVLCFYAFIFWGISVSCFSYFLSEQILPVSLTFGKTFVWYFLFNPVNKNSHTSLLFQIWTHLQPLCQAPSDTLCLISFCWASGQQSQVVKKSLWNNWLIKQFQLFCSYNLHLDMLSADNKLLEGRTTHILAWDLCCKSLPLLWSICRHIVNNKAKPRNKLCFRDEDQDQETGCNGGS